MSQHLHPAFGQTGCTGLQGWRYRLWDWLSPSLTGGLYNIQVSCRRTMHITVGVYVDYETELCFAFGSNLVRERYWFRKDCCYNTNSLQWARKPCKNDKYIWLYLHLYMIELWVQFCRDLVSPGPESCNHWAWRLGEASTWWWQDSLISVSVLHSWFTHCLHVIYFHLLPDIDGGQEMRGQTLKNCSTNMPCSHSRWDWIDDFCKCRQIIERNIIFSILGRLVGLLISKTLSSCADKHKLYVVFSIVDTICIEFVKS